MFICCRKPRAINSELDTENVCASPRLDPSWIAPFTELKGEVRTLIEFQASHPPSFLATYRLLVRQRTGGVRVDSSVQYRLVPWLAKFNW